MYFIRQHNLHASSRTLSLFHFFLDPFTLSTFLRSSRTRQSEFSLFAFSVSVPKQFTFLSENGTHSSIFLFTKLSSRHGSSQYTSERRNHANLVHSFLAQMNTSFTHLSNSFQEATKHQLEISSSFHSPVQHMNHRKKPVEP